LTTPRIYFPRISEEDNTVELREENLGHIKNVLRLKKGDHLILFDGTRFEYETVIRDIRTHYISLEIILRESIRFPDINITLAQSLIKSAKMDFIIQKTTELGVIRIIPFVSSRSIPKLSENKSSARVSRWRKIAVETSRQCRRAIIPEITDIISFDEMLKLPGENDLRIFFWEEEFDRGLKKILRDKNWKGTNNFFLVVGPEGGFSREEAEKAKKNTFLSATLGKYILRAETAPLTILSILQYERGVLNSSGEREKTE